MSRSILTYIFIFFVFNSLFLSYRISCNERFRYISTERPKTTYVNLKYLWFNITSTRFVRTTPIYYVGLHAKTLIWMDNNTTLSFYFYEYLTNVYKRGFIELHFKFCDMVNRDKIFGASITQALNSTKTCPFPPDEYHLFNMTMGTESFPRGFPFIKGRIYCNVTYANNILLGSAYIDMEMKEIQIKRNSKTKKSITLV